MDLQGSTRLCLPSARIIGKHHHARLLCGVLGSKLSSLLRHSKHFAKNRLCRPFMSVSLDPLRESSELDFRDERDSVLYSFRGLAMWHPTPHLSNGETDALELPIQRLRKVVYSSSLLTWPGCSGLPSLALHSPQAKGCNICKLPLTLSSRPVPVLFPIHPSGP